MVKIFYRRGWNVFCTPARTNWLGHAVLCAERAVGGDPRSIVADDFLTGYEPGVTADLAQAFGIAKRNFQRLRLMGLRSRNMALSSQMVRRWNLWAG